MRIDPNSPKHRRLVDLVKARRDFAKRELAGPKDRWRDAEKLYRSFIDTEEKTEEGKKRHPFADSIVLPLTYALTQTQLAFDLAAFTQRSPMIPLDGVGPEDVRPARVMEQVLHHESVQQRQLIDLYGWLLDRRRYGCGFLWNSWTQDVGYRTRTIVEPGWSFLGLRIGRRVRQERETVLRFEGNQSWVQSPFNLWWDPRVPLARIQEGEFVGRQIRRSFSYMREQEIAGFYTNVDRIPKDPKMRRAAAEEGTGGGSEANRIVGLTELWASSGGDSLDFMDQGYVDLDEACIRLIPKDYELDGSDVPEKWWITLANDSIITRAERYDPDHQDFPVSVMEASPDPHSRINPGSVEVLAGLNRVATWLFNCYDDQTDILTERGFVLFSELRDEDRVATVHPDSREFWFEKPGAVVRQSYTGDMVRILSSRVDLSVTPNHEMWVAKQVNRDGEPYEKFGMVLAENLDGQYKLQGAAWWGGGVTEGELVLPAELPQRHRGADPLYPEKRIPYAVLAPFLGFFVSEGSCTHSSSGNYAVSIRQKKPAVVATIDAVMTVMPWHVVRYVDALGGVSWTISDRRLYRWALEQCGDRADRRRVPDLVFTFGMPLLTAFLDAAMDGDGHWLAPPHDALGQYGTTSRVLADGLHACLIRAGCNVSLSLDRPTITGKPVYRLNVSARGTDYVVSTGRNVTREPYSGMVYCVDNSTELIIVRRNGRVCVNRRSHIENVKKTLNDMLIVNPGVVEMQDVTTPQPGRLIRIKREFYDDPQAFEKAVKQLQVTDVTRTHMGDIAGLVDMAQRVAAAPENLQGIISGRDRTLGEQQMAMNSATSRLRAELQLAWVSGVVPWTRQRISNVQQYMSEERWVKIVGKWPQTHGVPPQYPFLRVGPQDVLGQFTYQVIDGVVRASDQVAKTMTELWTQAVGDALLRQIYDTEELFKDIAVLMGFANVDDYLRANTGRAFPTAQVLPDEQVSREVERGNLQPGAGPAFGQLASRRAAA